MKKALMVILALVTALTLVIVSVSSVFAKPLKGYLTPYSGVSGTAQYSLSQQHIKGAGYGLKCTIVLKGVEPDAEYSVEVNGEDGWLLPSTGMMITNSRGDARATFSSNFKPYSLAQAGIYYFDINISEGSGLQPIAREFYETSIEVSFK